MKVIRRRPETIWEIAFPPSCKKILNSIATDGPQSKYELAKSTHLSYPRVLENIKSLEKFALIEGKDTRDKAKKTGLPLKKYSLTRWGLINALALQCQMLISSNYEDSNYKDCRAGVERIAKNYSSYLPLIFEKLSHFYKFGAKNILIDELLHNASELSQIEYQTFGVPTKVARKMATEYLREFDKQDATRTLDALTGKTLFEPLLYGTMAVALDKKLGFSGPIKIIEMDREAWLKALTSDCEIKTFVLKYLQRMGEEAIKYNRARKIIQTHRLDLFVSKKSSKTSRLRKDEEKGEGR